MAVEPEQNQPGPRKLSLVVYSGAFAKVHYALVLASASAAVGTPATLFFTMNAAKFLRKPLADGTAGWRSLPARPNEAAGGGPAAHVGPASGAVDDDYAKQGVATFEVIVRQFPQSPMAQKAKETLTTLRSRR